MMREDERMPARYEVTIERGAKRVFAGANAWPGWCRGGRTEEEALEALLTYGRRYAKVMGRRRLGYVAPTDVGRLRVVERLTGNATTDFGAPGVAPRSDDRAVDEDEAGRLAAIMKACWSALDRAAAAADGLVLRTGPRGGGRKLAAIVEHVADAEVAYLSKLGARPSAGDPRATIVAVFASRARGEPPERTPRSGVLWTPRYFMRRAAWHVLDHAWEIEDRTRPVA
ncbi:MAG TPA: hypothetical protein VHN56_07895 [Actinomycetota bacterium]|jgi:hypothetical protein|nr:hypothetical protein [Actinomycetota bacterium]